ncbi:BZ3500_MvSof-1268-A1-R1_Chr3-2g06283 [Microbotryum saponariae]|uniref:BZ3500_MvSof-1268-A1-R1_Chr3-2g06283 protein n=1 Tax=Microbotryum saponariae TaxID=289078 RepID=A0A2X0N163_9BASI|nr:BZ3500_MvSof-1268-A1-R1_Chr3-2g06283 [Microbotryum saponariae]SDA04254.1 BZ3501_MvSof-1269-A2-R1_Chr3-2g05974 [Microbotryum saponariae]
MRLEWSRRDKCLVSSRKINHLPHPNTTKQTERYTRKVAVSFPRSRTPLASDRDIGGEKRCNRRRPVTLQPPYPPVIE